MNPYLAFAAMLMAMLDGIRNKIQPGEPLDKDIYDLEPEELAKVPKTPGSLEERWRTWSAITNSCCTATSSRATSSARGFGTDREGSGCPARAAASL